MKKSGVVSRFGIKLVASSNSSDNDDAMVVGGSPVRSHDEDSSSSHESGLTVDIHSHNTRYTTVDSVVLAPPTSISIARRENVWLGAISHISMKTGSFMDTFCYAHEEIRQNAKWADSMTKGYQKMLRIPRFAARFQRLATALLASWLYYLSPSKMQSTELRKEAVVKSINQLLESYIIAVGLLLGETEVKIREDPRTHTFIAAIVAYDGIVRRCYANSLRFKRQKLCQACLVFLGDLLCTRYYSPSSTPTIIKDLLPSITNTADKVLEAIVPLEPVSTAVPSDIPLSAFDGSRCDMFENDERIRLYLIAPKRVPYVMMVAPPSSHFAYATLPDAYDDYSMPGMLVTNAQNRGAVNNAEEDDFIGGARVKTAEYLRTAKNLVTTTQGRSLLPLCAVSVMDKAMRNDGLHNEDRWWVANFVNDTADFDIEDLGDLFDVFAGRAADKHTRRFKHMMAHRVRYNEAIAQSVAGGFPPLVTTSCKTMNNLTYERTERRGAYCPFVASNHATGDEIRQLLKWQGLDFDEESIESIVEFASQGNQAEGCLAHYNAILKARGDNGMRQKVIKMPPIFAHLQAIRRDTEQHVNV